MPTNNSSKMPKASDSTQPTVRWISADLALQSGAIALARLLGRQEAKEQLFNPDRASRTDDRE